MENIHDVEVKDDSIFFTPEQGDNYCRIVSGFIARTITFPSGDQSLKYTCLVIDRRDNKIRVADFGKQVMKQLKAFAKNKEYAFTDLPPYDVNVQREGAGQFDTKYTVLPARVNTPLTEAENTGIREFGLLKDFLAKGKDPVQQNVAVQTGRDPSVPPPPAEEGQVRVEDIPF